MAIQPRELGKVLYEYEEERLPFYSAHKIKGFLAWQVVRRPLYYSLLRQDFFGASGTTAKTSLVTYLKAFLKFPIQVLVLLFRKKRIQAFVVANEVYKLEKNKQGRDVNVFTDHWYTLSHPSQTILLEYTQGKKDPGKSSLTPDLDTNAIKFVVRIVTNALLRLGWSHRAAGPLNSDINRFCRAHSLELPNCRSVLNTIFIKFLVDYYSYRFLFGVFRPRVIVAADSVGTGMMAAAKRSGIRVIELQHGLLDTYKPDYVLAPVLASEQQQLVIPDYLAVFGDYYKNFLEKGHFWPKEQLVPVGNSRIDTYRAKRNRGAHAQELYTILVPTQWNYLPETKELLGQLKEVTNKFSVRLFIKTHPREPQHHVEWYKEFCQQNAAFLFGNETSIYELFTQSDLVIGFDSTSLLESLALGIPTITIVTKTAPRGLHSYNPDALLEASIKVSEIRSVAQLVRQTLEDPGFIETWEKQISLAGDYLYKKDCVTNCKNLLERCVTQPIT